MTGGAGFIGSHVARRLLGAGEPVVVLDDFNPFYDPELKRANARALAAYTGSTIVEGDVRDEALVESLFARHRFDRVAHMAALAGVRASMEQAQLYLSVNALGTGNLLEAARRHGCELFVLASTSSVYGRTTRLPFVEDDAADRPLAAYPASKRAAELMAHACHHLFGLPVTCLRFFNVYGPAGRPDMMPMRVMSAVVDGSELPVFDGGALERDWTYIDDTVDGVLAALERPMGYEVLNLGFGRPLSLDRFIATIEQLSGRTLRRRPLPAPPSEPPITFCDNRKARRLLGFDPQVSVEEGLERTWAWFSKIRDL
ncbi:MAG: NAD-dependent epimerase/dehydratase family protein [Myxococcota bacterium]